MGGGTLPTLADLFQGRYLGSGVDFASIRVHYASGGVDRACRALGARAFTVGSDVYFAAALRFLMSGAFDRLGTPTDAGH